jgi:hypothetical protein
MFEHLHFLYNEATNMSKTKDKAEILAVIRDALLNYEELLLARGEVNLNYILP